jgi:Endonuclease I/Abnormal spindle-like microcephaly-assoc'd, ASPM-SPD-2-Hydin/HYDIN/CFA65/VesB-like, Ig-like domain
MSGSYSLPNNRNSCGRCRLLVVMSACLALLPTQVFLAQAQDVTFSPPTVDFDTVDVNVRDSISVMLHNTGTDTVTVTDILGTKAAFTVHPTAQTIPPGDSATLRISFETHQNVTWKDVLIFESSGTHGPLPLSLCGTAVFPDTRYASTQNLWENELKDALLALISNQTVLTYFPARDRMFETIDDPAGTDTIECVYSGRRIHAATRLQAQSQSFNTEHTWPQSKFNSEEPMQSDLHHLFPTDSAANTARSNLPFAPVISNIMYNVGGSKAGFSPNGLPAFEPRDVHKGDAARAMFYFVIRYGNRGTFLDQLQEIYLRSWYTLDPVSQKERDRNNAIEFFQKNRNPFVDHPEFLERISVLRNTVAPALQPDIRVSPPVVNFGSIAAGDSAEWRILIANSGRAPLHLTGIAPGTSSPAFRIIDSATIVEVDTFAIVRLRFVPPASGATYVDSVVIRSDDPDAGTVVVSLSGSSTGSTVVQESAAPALFSLFPNYPNPFNPTTTIHYTNPVAVHVRLQVFDVLGREVIRLVDEEMPPGEHAVVWTAGGVSSGVYMYRLIAGNMMMTRRMMVLR